MIAEPDPSIPEVRGIMKLPVMRDDGSVAIAEGYDPVSKFYIAPELTIEELPERPTYEDVQRAKAVINDVFGDFAWKSWSHGTAAVAVVLEQVIRNMIRGARPLYAITASGHGQGSGKSLLADVCGYIIHGDRNHAGTWPENEEELKKLITTKLRQRTSYYVFDNIDKTVSSPALAALTTSNSWSSRILGVNKEFASENMTTWVLTLNNARLSKDLSRRSIIIHLDLGVARAIDEQKKRKFRHDDLRAYTKDLKVRASVVRALMIFTRFWISAGKPRDTSLRFTSFAEWQNTVASILTCAGFPSVKEALEDAVERDVDEEKHLNLLSYWHSKYGEQWIQAVDLARDATSEGVIALGGKNDSWLARNLVDMVKPLTDRVYEGHIIRTRVTNGKVQFRLETVKDD
jgi:putative DNA primase/helicase